MELFLKTLFAGISDGLDPVRQIRIRVLLGKHQTTVVHLIMGNNVIPPVKGCKLLKLHQGFLQIQNLFLQSAALVGQLHRCFKH